MSEWMGAEDHVHRALEHYERGRWADAEAELRKALAAEPNRGEWQLNLGLTLEAAGRPLEALDCYRRAIELMPEEADPLVAAGTVANRLGRHDEAVALLEQAVARRRDDDTSHAVWIDSLVCLDRLDEAEMVFHLAQQSIEECPRSLAAVAEALIRRGQWRRAEWCLREALRLEPGLPRVRARLGLVVAEQGGVERAVQLYLRELRDDPGAIDTQLDYGDLLVRLGRLGEAAERYRRVLELEPANIDAHRGLGRTAVLAGRHEQAVMEFELVAKLDPSAPQIRLDLAEALLAMDRSGEAAAKLLEESELLAAGECRTDPCRLGVLMLRAGEPKAAIPLLQGAAERLLAKTHASTHFSKAAFRHANSGDGGADPSDTENLETPEASVLASVGAAQTLLGRLGDAAAPALSAVEVLRQLALARFSAGDLAGGVADSRRVLKLDPTCVGSFHNLALAMLRSGRPRRAAAFIRAGMRVDGQDEGLRRLRIRVWAATASVRVHSMLRALRRAIGSRWCRAAAP